MTIWKRFENHANYWRCYGVLHGLSQRRIVRVVRIIHIISIMSCFFRWYTLLVWQWGRHNFFNESRWWRQTSSVRGHVPRLSSICHDFCAWRASCFGMESEVRTCSTHSSLFQKNNVSETTGLLQFSDNHWTDVCSTNVFQDVFT